MQKMTLEELREKTGIAAARLVRKWKEGAEVDGKVVCMEEVEDGRLWWLEGEDADELIKEEVEESTEEEERVYTTHHLVAESHIHGRTTAGLEGAGLVTVQDILDEIEDKGNEKNAIKHLSSSKFNGVGKSGAKDTVRWALRMANLEAREFFCSGEEEEDPETFTCETCGDTFTHQTETIGRICKTCRRDVEAESTKVQSAYPEFVYELDADDVASAKRMVDARKAGDEVPRAMISQNCRLAFLKWVNSEFGVDINCPHCGDLYDTAPVSEFVSGTALCENMDEIEGRGDCGEKFWVEATEDGYETCPEWRKKGEGSSEEGQKDSSLFEETNPEAPPTDDRGADDWDDDTWEVSEDLAVVTLARKSLPFEDRVHPALPECKLLARTEAHSDDWHEARSKGVGSSDAGAVLGLSPYASPIDTWKSKVGQETERQPWLEEYSKFGTWFEPHLREWCEIEYGIEIIDGADLGTLQSIQWPHALANIDGLDTTTGTLEEYKTTTEKWSTIPMQYEAQVQHQMYVTGAMECRLRQFVCPLDRVHFPSLLKRVRRLAILEEDADEELAAWLFEIGEVHTWIIERDDAYIERLIEAEKTFWDFVQIEVEPPEQDPDGTVDLSEDPGVVAACEEYARLNGVYEDAIGHFIKAERIPTEGRGSITGKAKKALKESKKKARKAIERAIALHPEDPKRVVMGEHKATLVVRPEYSYWNLYSGDANDWF